MGITDPSELHFGKGLWGFDGSVWRKLPMLWGFSAGWVEDLGGTKSGAGTYSQLSTAVPAGYVYVLHSLLAINNTGARGLVQVYKRSGGTVYTLNQVNAPAQYVPVSWSGALALAAGDQVGVYMTACLDGDAIDACAVGYKMAVT